MVGTAGSIGRMRVAGWPPVPPIEMPPARTVRVADHGEFFVRDTGGNGAVVMLLHGWIATADLNWWATYGDLAKAGYRVLAIDHRGHGRGLRPLVPFRLADCAADAAAVLRALDGAPAVVVGYSMGGAVAQLVARDHPDVVDGLVLSGTAQHWQDPASRRDFRTMGALGLILNCVVLWNTRYMNTALNALRAQGYPVLHEDVARLSPFVREHLNVVGNYTFALPDLGDAGIRPLRDPDAPDDDDG